MISETMVSETMIRTAVIFFLFTLLAACGNDKQTGPVDVKWDRDSCQRCQMMLSERNFSAQIRVFPPGKRSKVFKFDDIGCAVLWLSKEGLSKEGLNKEGPAQSYNNDPKTEIWVNDYKTKKWINAKQAWFVKGVITPMGYGLGAQSEKVEGAMNYDEAVKHIYLVEKKLNIHGGNLEH